MTISALPRSLPLLVVMLTALLLAPAPCAHASDTASAPAPLVAGSTLDSLTFGKITYTQVRVRTVSAQTAMIQHAGGIASLRLRDLTPDLQQRFGYNPDAAAAEAEKQKAATTAAAELRQRQLAAQKKIPVARPPETTPAEIDDSKTDQLLRSLGQPPEVRTKVDLRPRYNELGLWIKNQGFRPSCAVFAVVSALEFQSAEITGKAERFSEEYLLWATYKLLNKKPRGIPEQTTSRAVIPEDLEKSDEGFLLREVVTALRTYGIPTRDRLPYQVWGGNENDAPAAEIIQEARTARRVSIHPLPGRDPESLTVNAIHALNQGIPVAIGLIWPDSVPYKSGYIDRQKATKGYGHAVTLVGYKSDRGTLEDTVFTFKNSYGTEWGIDGYGFVTYRYLIENITEAIVLEIQLK
jgi:hypothetical protein